VQRTCQLTAAALWLCLLCLVFTACAGRVNANPAAHPTVQTSVTVQPPPTLLPATAPPSDTPPSPASSTVPIPTAGTPDEPALPEPHYKISVNMDYGRHHLAVSEQINYTNRSGEPIPNLLLIVEPSRYPATFHLKALTWGDGQAVSSYTTEIGFIHLPLSNPLPPGERVSLTISYELDLPSPDPTYYGRPVPFGYSANQTNLVDWYPYLPPYQAGQGWLAHQAGAFGEYLVYEDADFEVDLHLSGSSLPLTVAASAPAEPTSDGYRYQFSSARNFAWSVSDQYQVLTAQVGDVTILGYAFPIHATAGAAALQATLEALQVYDKVFSPYPHQTLSLVEADFLDGMEYDGLFFLSKGFYNLYAGTPGEYLIAIAAHETSHQWWYGLVGSDQALEPWLDEALATYSERIYYENTHPEALDWWWAYRVNYYQPAGWVDGSIYNPQGYRAYRDAIYLNGALFLEQLRQQMGDQAFFAFLRDYLAHYSQRIATGADFFNLLKQHTSSDLSGLIAKYFQHGH
jgi:hypothetical protein